MRAALYARVSTTDKGQDPGMQIPEMEEMAVRRGWTPKGYTDVGFSGSKESRPALDAMMSDCRKGKIGVVMVWSLDRLARSVRQLVNLAEEFKVLGIQLIVIKQEIDTTTPNGRLIFHILAAIAEFERELIRERVRSGIAHARAKGKTLGRPLVSASGEEIAKRRAQGQSWRTIASEMGLNRTTARRIALRTSKVAQKGVKIRVRKSLKTKA